MNLPSSDRRLHKFLPVFGTSSWPPIELMLSCVCGGGGSGCPLCFQASAPASEHVPARSGSMQTHRPFWAQSHQALCLFGTICTTDAQYAKGEGIVCVCARVSVCAWPWSKHAPLQVTPLHHCLTPNSLDPKKLAFVWQIVMTQIATEVFPVSVVLMLRSLSIVVLVVDVRFEVGLHCWKRLRCRGVAQILFMS